MANYFVILGLTNQASDLAVAEAHRQLQTSLAVGNFPIGSLAQRQAISCLEKIELAYQQLRDPQKRQLHAEGVADYYDKIKPEEYKPFLGHLCVAAGIINIDELLDAIGKQTDIDLPLGQILQERQLLSQTQLDGMLMGQRLYGSPNRRPDDLTIRLLEFGLITRDMIKVVFIDQRTQWLDLPELLVKRNWVAAEVVHILQKQAGIEPTRTAEP